MVQSEEIGPFEFQKLSHFQNKVKWKKNYLMRMSCLNENKKAHFSYQ